MWMQKKRFCLSVGELYFLVWSEQLLLFHEKVHLNQDARVLPMQFPFLMTEWNYYVAVQMTKTSKSCHTFYIFHMANSWQVHTRQKIKASAVQWGSVQGVRVVTKALGASINEED